MLQAMAAACDEALDCLEDAKLAASDAREPVQLILHMKAVAVPCSCCIKPLQTFIASKVCCQACLIKLAVGAVCCTRRPCSTS